jgi:hypothetical protein
MNDDDPSLMLDRAALRRREFMRWILLLTANLSRPGNAVLRTLLNVVQSEYPDATALEVRRELDYLESRKLLTVMTTPMGELSVDLTRHGIDVVEYTVPVEPGIARPVKG